MALEGNMSFREVVQNDCHALQWKEISVSTGSSGSSSDGKFSEVAGGYGYRDSARVGSPARNRFIYWRTSKDTLELVEISLDCNLQGNAVRFHFQGASLIPGLSIFESHGNVYVLVPTACSVHRLMFPHPNKLQKYEHQFSGDQRTASIFADASIAQDPTNCHRLTGGGGASAANVGGASVAAISAGAWLSSDGEAVFALAMASGSILLVRLPRAGLAGIVVQHELKQSSLMSWLWTGLVGSAGTEDATLALAVHPLGTDTFVFAVCRDHKFRMWSVKSHECVMVTDLLDYMPDNYENAKLTLSGAGHMIKKCVGSTTSQQLHLCVHLCFTTTSQFCVFQPFLADGRYQLHHVTTVFGAQDELVDYIVTPQHLWTVWNTSSEETCVRTAPIEQRHCDMNVKRISRFTATAMLQKHCMSAVQQWMHVEMMEEDLNDPAVPEGEDPKEVYIHKIFHPGQFSIDTLLKTLNIYKRSLDISQLVDSHIPIEALKSEVISVVENEVMGYEQSAQEEDYVHLATAAWAKFYSRCTQYHERSTKPLGVYADANTGMVSIVKRGAVSYIRPSHAAEHLYLTPPENCSPEQLHNLPIIGDDPNLCGDVVSLCDCLKTLNAAVTEEVESYIEGELYQGQSPEIMAATVITNMLADGRPECVSVVRELELQVQGVGELTGAADSLLLLLDFTHNIPEDQHQAVNAGRQLSVSRVFSSSTAIKLLCDTVDQLATSRLDMTRDLLLLLTMMTKLGPEAGINFDTCAKLRSELIPKSAQMLQAYFVLKWATRIVVQHPSAAVIDLSQRQLESLELADMGAASTLHHTAGLNMKVLELFLTGYGGRKVREALSQQQMFDEDPCALWSQALMPTAVTIMQILWPLSPSFVFAEFLLSHCQYSWLREYVTLCSPWCEWNAASRKFMQGLSSLNMDSGSADLVQCFVEAVHGVASDEFLVSMLHAEDHDQQHLDVLYFLKVLAVLEQHGLPELVVTLAKTAISLAEPDDPNVPTLWSKVFKQELELGNHEDAYTAMIFNPDASRRKDCLRQLLVVLCERKKLETLVGFTYKERSVDMEDDVVSILESRARAIDLTKHNYYDLLYAFHVYRQNYRKAGSVMWEHGMRLGMEMQGLKGLQRQAKCYLAALNALRLVDPKYAWIIRPLSSSHGTEEEGGDRRGKTIKHTLGGESITIPSRRRVDLLELDEMEKEYMLVHARLQLLQRQPNPDYMTGPTASSDETIMLLVNAGLFDSAINICRMFNLPLTSMFEGLTSRCINLAENSHGFMQGENEYTAEAWDWLRLNELPPSSAGKDESAGDAAWHLLQHYLTRYEDTDNTSRYHRVTALRFLAHNFPLPNWFTASYKKRCASELLRLYLGHDHLEDAAQLTMEYVDAVMGKGHEYFGLSSFLHCDSPPVWLPYTCIDQLIVALQELGRTEPTYQKLYDALQQKMDHYLSTLETVTRDTITTKQQRDYQMRQHNFAMKAM